MTATIQKILKPTKYRAVDTSGNNNHGQIYSGRALEFDGLTDYLDLGASTTFIDFSEESTAANRAWTIAAWINYDSVSSVVKNVIGDGNVTRSCGYAGISTSEKLRIYDYEVGTEREGNTVLQPQTWYRAVWSFDGISTVTFYLNGIADGTGDIGTSNDAKDDKDLRFRYIGVWDPAQAIPRYWEGKMSDVQAWQGAWSASDALYDYNNPESLALNNGGTSLTESNLKLWYPMQDGHRGQQSYILDGANTGLSDDIAGDGGFDIDVANNDTGTYWKTISSAWTITGGVASHAGSNTVQLRKEGVVVGTTYKIQFDIVSNTGGGSISLDTDGTTTPARSAVGTYTEYLTATTTNLDFTPTNDFIGTIDNVKIYPVNDKHHATTVFYGDNEMTDYLTAAQETEFGTSSLVDDVLTFDANDATKGCNGDLGAESISHDRNQIFDEAGQWISYGSPTSATIVGGKLQVETTGDSTSEGAQLPVANLTTPVAGQAYRIAAYLDDVGTANADATYKFYFGGSEGVLVTASDGSPTGGVINTSNQEYYADVVATNTTGNLEIRIVADDNDAATTFTIDAVSVKPIPGWLICKASGVDTADTLGNSSGNFKFQNTAAGAARMALPISGLTAGRTYIVKGASSAGAIKLSLSGTLDGDAGTAHTFGTAFTSGNSGQSADFTADSTGVACIYAENNVSTENEYVRLDNVTIQEVGTATGWTDADQELDIPQTALQSYNQLAWFDGKNDIVIANDDFTPGNLTTVAFWVFLNGDDDEVRGLIDNIDWTNSGWRITADSNNRLTLQTSSGSGTDDGSVNTYTSTATIMTRGRWIHCVATFNYLGGASNGHFLYIDGEDVGSSASNTNGAHTMTKTADVFNIGYGGGLTQSYLNGCITEISVWSDMLSLAQVQELYNDGKGLDARKHSEENANGGSLTLVHYWKNNGLAQWDDLEGSNYGAVTCSDTLLLPAGVDASRDNQGFLMNRQKDTNSLNFHTNTIAGGLTDNSDHVSVPGRIDLGTSDFSVSFWAYKFWDWEQQIVCSQFVDGSNRFYIKASGSSAKMLIFAYSGGNAVLYDSDSVTINVVGGDYLEKWMHVVCAVDRSAEIKWYINGTNTSTGTVDGSGSEDSGQESTSLTLNADFKIGRDVNPNVFDEHHFDGQIDDFLLYSKYLSVDEVTRIYNAGKRSHK